jgi:conserved hypothetical protein TIGR00043
MTLNTLSLSLQFGRFDGVAAHRAVLPRHKVTRWIRHALATDAEITVRIVGAEEGQQLNRDYRKKDYATNVLTFDYTQEPLVTADLVLCAPVVEREARDRTKAWKSTTPTCWCTARCMPRAGTTKPVPPMPTKWKPTKPPSCKSWALPTRTPNSARHQTACSKAIQPFLPAIIRKSPRVST